MSASAGGDEHRGSQGDPAYDHPADEHPTPPSTTSLREEKLNVGPQLLTVQAIGSGHLWGVAIRSPQNYYD